ncbi:MAG TPA: IS21 family transposase, partial [Nitrospirae bacterium]|nr:IS21 family transposase [Nitrospirota bacterium]
MITPAYRQIILEMAGKGVSLREISRTLKVSRNTVRTVIKSGEAPESARKTKYIEHL